MFRRSRKTPTYRRISSFEAKPDGNFALQNHFVLVERKPRFNSICYELVTKKQEKRPHIKRVYVRAEFPDISGDYREYLLENYEETYFPAAARGAGRAVYVKRNCEMIEKSDICVFYLNESGAPKNRKSGTEIAFNYALKRKKQIIRLNG